jgi:hypothetical protein
MPLRLNDLLQKCKTPFLSTGATKLFHSVWYTAAMLTVLIIILIMVIYPGKAGTPVWILGKLGIYVFLISAGIIFLHGCIISNAQAEKLGGDADDRFIEKISGGGNIAFSGDNMKISPSIGETRAPDTVEPTTSSPVSGGSDDIFAMYGV